MCVYVMNMHEMPRPIAILNLCIGITRQMPTSKSSTNQPTNVPKTFNLHTNTHLHAHPHMHIISQHTYAYGRPMTNHLQMRNSDSLVHTVFQKTRLKQNDLQPTNNQRVNFISHCCTFIYTRKRNINEAKRRISNSKHKKTNIPSNSEKKSARFSERADSEAKAKRQMQNLREKERISARIKQTQL